MPSNTDRKTGEKLGNLLEAERRKLAEAALSAGSVDQDAWSRLDRLAKLSEGFQHTSQRRWLIPALAAVTLVILTVLLVKEQSETEIELDATVTELHFRFPRKAALAGDQFLRSVRASSLAGLEIDGSDWPAASGSSCNLEVELASGPGKEDGITLSAIAPPAGWGVGISRAGTETTVEFSAPAKPADEEFTLRASVRGKSTLRSDCGPEGKRWEIAWNGPGAMTLRVREGTLVRSEPVPGSALEFARQVGFENLRLEAKERVQTGSAPLDRRLSSLVAGTLYLDALNAKPVTLRPFDGLAFGTSKGYIRALTAPADAKAGVDEFRLQAHATVGTMIAGGESNQRSLMPSWLEWLAANQPLSLLWGSAVSALGIIYAVLRQLRAV